MRWGFRICSRLKFQSSGQRQGESVNLSEIPHSVSPRTTMYRSGASGFTTIGVVGIWAQTAVATKAKALKTSAVIDLHTRCCIRGLDRLAALGAVETPFVGTNVA